MSRLIRKLTPEEKKTQCSALGFFLTGCAFVLILQITVGLYFTPHYFIAHFMLGLFLPFLFYSMGGIKLSFWIGLFVTSIFHFGYELWEDQLTRSVYSPDWDQINSGGVGLLVAWLIFYLWNKKIIWNKKIRKN